jgi:hypothetical protein
MNYREELTKLKNELKGDKDIRLINYDIMAGIGEAMLSELGTRFVLPEEVKAFYRVTNGLRVRWEKKGHPAMGEAEGVINILPLEQSLLKDWEGFLWFAFEEKYPVEYQGKVLNMLDLKKALRPFDLYQEDLTVAFYLEDVGLSVMLGRDHNADFISYAPAEFGEYMRFLFGSRGSVEGRSHFFKKY